MNLCRFNPSWTNDTSFALVYGPDDNRNASVGIIRCGLRLLKVLSQTSELRYSISGWNENV